MSELQAALERLPDLGLRPADLPSLGLSWAEAWQPSWASSRTDPLVALGLPPLGTPQVDIAGWAEDAVLRCVAALT